jgi:hypothetical protein
VKLALRPALVRTRVAGALLAAPLALAILPALHDHPKTPSADGHLCAVAAAPYDLGSAADSNPACPLCLVGGRVRTAGLGGTALLTGSPHPSRSLAIEASALFPLTPLLGVPRSRAPPSHS